VSSILSTPTLSRLEAFFLKVVAVATTLLGKEVPQKLFQTKKAGRQKRTCPRLSARWSHFRDLELNK